MNLIHSAFVSLKDNFSNSFGLNMSAIDVVYNKIKQSSARFEVNITIDFDPIKILKLSNTVAFWQSLSANNFQSARSTLGPAFQTQELLAQCWFISFCSIGTTVLTGANTNFALVSALSAIGCINTESGIILDPNSKLFAHFGESSSNSLYQTLNFLKLNVLNIKLTVVPVFYKLDDIYEPSGLIFNSSYTFVHGINKNFIDRKTIDPQLIKIIDNEEFISSFNLSKVFDSRKSVTKVTQWSQFLNHSETKVNREFINPDTFSRQIDLTAFLCGSINQLNFGDESIPGGLLSNTSSINPVVIYYNLVLLNCKLNFNDPVPYVSMISFYNIWLNKNINEYLTYPVTIDYYNVIFGFHSNPVVSAASLDRAANRAARAPRVNAPAAPVPEEGQPLDGEAFQFNINNIEQIQNYLHTVNNRKSLDRIPHLDLNQFLKLLQTQLKVVYQILKYQNPNNKNYRISQN